MKFDMKHFFMLGIFCFGVIVLLDIYSLIIVWKLATWVMKVRSIVMILFYSGLVAVFIYNYKMTKQAPPSLEAGNLNEMIEEIEDKK